MATRLVSSVSGRARRRERTSAVSARAAVLAGVMPLLFLHARYQPTASFSAGSASVDVTAADLAIAAVVATAFVVAVREGLAPLRATAPLWAAAGLLAAWLAVETLRPAAVDDPAFADHLVSAAKAVEYGLVALAVPLLCRRIEELALLLGVLAATCAAAAAVAVLQFFGLGIFDGWKAGWRQPSFVGHHDLAALAALCLASAAAAIVLGRARGWAIVTALAAGALALILSGSVAAAGGFALAAGAVALLAWRRVGTTARRLAALAALVAVVAGGVAGIRADPLAEFMRFIGTRDDRQAAGIETYSQRTVLAYIGLRIFDSEPLVGVGWQRSDVPEVFGPYVDDARRRFPNVAPEAFPAPERRWGVQNAYVQSLADLGLVGFALLASVFVLAGRTAWRAARRLEGRWLLAALAALGACIALAGLWSALGLVPGIPLELATSLAFGVAAACAAEAASRDRLPVAPGRAAAGAPLR